MSDITAPARAKTPWHLWAVAILTLLWNGSGAYTIMMAQAGLLPGLTADEAAYYAAQPLWFVIVTDVALVTPLLAGVALLLRRDWAVWLFAISLAAILVTNLYDIGAGASRALANTGAAVVTLIIVVLAVLQLLYAWAMKRKGVLR